MRIEINQAWPRTTHQEKKYGRGRVYEPDNLKAAREWWMWMLRPFAPKVALQGPLRVRIEFGFRSKLRGPRIQRPDFDNLPKLPCDCMTALGYWRDDAQISDGGARKMNAEADYVIIEIEVMT
jgi:Holliday junction resolvase RusA-like endonuclease